MGLANVCPMFMHNLQYSMRNAASSGEYTKYSIVKATRPPERVKAEVDSTVSATTAKKIAELLGELAKASKRYFRDKIRGPS